MNKLEIEIKNLKQDVLITGMNMSMYLSKKRYLIYKIEYLSNNSLKFFQQLYSMDIITKQQYIDMKIKVDASRKYYKSLLSFI